MSTRSRAWLLLVSALALGPAPAHAQRVREVAARVHEQGGYDSHLRVQPPSGRVVTYGGGGTSRTRSPSSSSSSNSSSNGGPRRSARHDAPIVLEAGSAALSWALVASVIVLAAGLLFLLVRARPRGGELAPSTAARRRAYVPRAREPASPLPGRELDLDADPDALAAEERFAEAIAAALLHGLLAVGWRPEGHGKSRTAREILASVDDPEARRVLGELVAIEERVAFGGDAATPERWTHARALWRRLSGASA